LPWKWAVFERWGVGVLRLRSGQVETLWDELLPVEARELPEDLAGIDAFLRDGALLEPIADHWEREALVRGRPAIAMETYVRLMVIKQSGWGYETLAREVSDSLHLRRFCLIGLSGRVPDESTIRKLTRRLGPEVGGRADARADREGCARAPLPRAGGEGRLDGRGGRHPLPDRRRAGAPRCAGAGARGPRASGEAARGGGTRVRDRSRSIGPGGAPDRTHAQTPQRRGEIGGDAPQRAGRPADPPLAHGGQAARRARRAARGRGAQAKLRAARQLEQLADRCERLAEQIAKRARGEKIENRLVSIADPDARPIRKGKLGKPTEFGYVQQLCELTENTGPAARGLILPPQTAPANPGENTLLPDTVAELDSLGLRPREVALDGGFGDQLSAQQFTDIQPQRIFVAGRSEPGSRRTRRRLARYRVGMEGRISHLKRRYGLRRSRLKGHQGQQIWSGWAVLAYNLDTLAVRAG
jgi:IS5 family transposase